MLEPSIARAGEPRTAELAKTLLGITGPFSGGGTDRDVVILGDVSSLLAFKRSLMLLLRKTCGGAEDSLPSCWIEIAGAGGKVEPKESF